MVREMDKTVTAVLLSAGLDSTVLAAREAQASIVQPLYISTGLAWEKAELKALTTILDSPPLADARPLVNLFFSVSDLYPPTHWAISGNPPDFDTPDEDVYLTGRNIILLSKAAIYCSQHGIERIALGSLAGNPFPDATPEFFHAIAHALSLALSTKIQIATPFASMHKPDVIRLGATLHVPLELTLSCMNPDGVHHCGQCSKCRERRDGFTNAGIEDLTKYAVLPPR